MIPCALSALPRNIGAIGNVCDSREMERGFVCIAVRKHGSMKFCLMMMFTGKLCHPAEPTEFVGCNLIGTYISQNFFAVLGIGMSKDDHCDTSIVISFK